MRRSNRVLLAVTSAGLLAACLDAPPSAPPSAPLNAAAPQSASVFTVLLSFGTGEAIGASGYSEGGPYIDSEEATIEDVDGNGERELVGLANILGLTVSSPGAISFTVESGSATALLRVASSGALVAVVSATAPAVASFTGIPAGSYYIELIPVPGGTPVIDDFGLGVPSSDVTPPVIVPTVTGTVGSDGWYTSNVTVSWNVTDAESAPTPGTGCGTTVISTDTPGTSLTCSATSGGGTNSNSVTVKRDASAPVIAFAGATSYTVDQTVSISCSATDPTSGIDTQTCPGASGAAYTFALGTNTLNASATNGAGLSATASLSFTVSVDYASLAALTSDMVGNAGVAGALNEKLAAAAAAPNASARAAMLRAYVNQIRAQTGKSISAEDAAILILLAASL